MKVSIQKNHLSTATNRAQGAISDRALAQIGLKAETTNILQVASTDRILAVYSSLECEVSDPGVIFVPGKLFSDVIKQLPDGMVDLSTEASFLIIKAASGFIMKLPLIEDMTWKDAPKLDSANAADLPTSKLTYMVNQVQFCIEHESARNYGAVGYLHRPEDGRLRLVGTDGFRLSYCDVKMELPAGFLKTGICLSKRGLSELQRMASEGFETIHLSIASDETTLLASSGNYQIFVRLSAVKYPNYRGVLPTANLNPVKLSRNNLQSVTKRVLLAADKTNAVRMCFDENMLTMSSRTAGSSESKESLPVTGYKGAKTDLSINGRFLQDVFSTVGSEEVTLQFKSEEDPIVIIPREEPFDCRSMHVLVPIRENA